MKTDPRVDAYIAKAAPFAQPILRHLRKLVHQGCPEVVETIKWGMPHFDYKGMFCGMAAFKEHCAFGFWKGTMAPENRKDGAMGSFGRITSRKDLPEDDVFLGYVKEAVRLKDSGVKPAPRPKTPRKALPVPKELKAALAKNAKARATFEAFSPSHQREYVEWIVEAKTDETRAKRLATAVEWMAEGKPRMWKYMKKPAKKG